MLFGRAGLSLTLLVAFATTAVYAAHIHHAPTSGHTRSIRKAKAPRHSTLKGQRQIDSERAREIQQALIHENYLSGEPTGQWDAETQVAMKRFQADHGWQTKIMPDSRALIKLGLGPTNPDDSSAAIPVANRSDTPKLPGTFSLPDDANTLAAIRSSGR